MFQINYANNSPQYLFRTAIQPELVEDLRNTDPHATELFIHGKTKGLDLLASFRQLTKLWIHSVSQKEFTRILNSVNPEMLYMYGMRVEDLSLLGNLSNLHVLGLEWNPKAMQLWDLSKNLNLTALTIKGFSKLRDITSLAQAPNIQLLELEVDHTHPLLLETLQPLKELKQLTYLGLSNIKVADESLQPLSELKGLKELAISNQFSTEEFAKLSVALPNTTCDKSSPFVRVALPDGLDLMVVGKRKPFLNSNKDSVKMKKYEERFRSLQEAYKIELEVRGSRNIHLKDGVE